MLHAFAASYALRRRAHVQLSSLTGQWQLAPNTLGPAIAIPTPLVSFDCCLGSIWLHRIPSLPPIVLLVANPSNRSHLARALEAWKLGRRINNWRMSIWARAVVAVCWHVGGMVVVARLIVGTNNEGGSERG